MSFNKELLVNLALIDSNIMNCSFIHNFYKIVPKIETSILCVLNRRPCHTLFHKILISRGDYNIIKVCVLIATF